MTDEGQERLRERMAELDGQKESAGSPLASRFQLARFLSIALFFSGVIVVGVRCIAIWRDYQGWRNAGADRSAREAYVTFLEVDLVLLVLVIAAFIGAAALVSWWADREPE